MGPIPMNSVASGGVLPPAGVAFSQNSPGKVSAEEAKKIESKASAHRVLGAGAYVLQLGIEVAGHIGAASLVPISHGTLSSAVGAVLVSEVTHKSAKAATDTVCAATEECVDSSIDCCVDHGYCK